MQPVIIIVDDDDEIRCLLSEFLLQYHYTILPFSSGKKLLAELPNLSPSLFILDVMMPEMSGLDLCKQLRLQINTPIIMLTALQEEVDCIAGLEIGADDYLSKPFSPLELLARIRAVLRRSHSTNAISSAEQIYQFDDWLLDKKQRQLYSVSGIEIILTTNEFLFLSLLVENAQQVLTRDKLMELTKGRDTMPFDRSIDVQMSRLRQKIEKDPKSPQLIKTIRNSGYILTANVEIKTK